MSIADKSLQGTGPTCPDTPTSGTLIAAPPSQLALFAEGSPASRSALPGSEQARKMTVTSGRRWFALLPRSGPLGYLARMCLGSSAWASTRCLLTWKTSVTPSGRYVFRLARSMPRTSESESGYWPTPIASAASPNEGNLRQLRAKVLAGELTENEAAAMLNGKSPFAARGKIPAFPATATVPGKQGREGGPNPQTTVGGRLNPTWVEWLMGFPEGWTDLKHSVTPSSRKSLR